MERSERPFQGCTWFEGVDNKRGYERRRARPHINKRVTVAGCSRSRSIFTNTCVHMSCRKPGHDGYNMATDTGPLVPSVCQMRLSPCEGSILGQGHRSKVANKRRRVHAYTPGNTEERESSTGQNTRCLPMVTMVEGMDIVKEQRNSRHDKCRCV